MTTGLLVTTVGRQKLAAFATGGAAVTISHIAVGDANGVPYAPADAQTALVNEKYRMTVSSLGVTSEPAINVEAIFPADTADAQNRPSHGFFVHELGVFDSTGALIAVARMGGGFKPAPTVGQASSRVLIAKLYFSNANSIVATVDTASWTHLGRLHGCFFLAHGGVVNAPPVSPAVGAFYIVGSAPTGAFAGQAGKITQWTGLMWVFKEAPVGLEVSDQSISDLANPAKIMRRNQAGTGWENATASASAYGRTIFATLAEVRAGVVTNKAIDPASLADATASKTLRLGVGANQTIPSSVFTAILFSGIQQNSEYATVNTANGEVTFLRAGQYDCRVRCPVVGSLTSSQVAFEFQKMPGGTGGVGDRPFDQAVSTYYTIGDDNTDNFAVGDKLKVNLFVAGGTTLLAASSGRNFLKLTRTGS